MRFRYFQTGLGRWTSRDPIGETGGFNLYQAFSNDPASQKDVFGLELNFPEPEFPKSTAKPLPDGRRWLGITNCSISLQISCEPCEESGCAKIKHSLTMNVTTTIPTLVDPMRRDGKVGPAIPLSQNILNLLRAHEDKHRQDCKNFHDYRSNALEANANASACAMDKATCEEVVKTLKNAFDIARAQLDARRDHAGGDDHWAEMKAIEDALQKERWSQFNGGK
jgi:predicted secreted Zn-dependent protease